jgi:hypothetical protein
LRPLIRSSALVSVRDIRASGKATRNGGEGRDAIEIRDTLTSRWRWPSLQRPQHASRADRQLDREACAVAAANVLPTPPLRLGYPKRVAARRGRSVCRILVWNADPPRSKMGKISLARRDVRPGCRQPYRRGCESDEEALRDGIVESQLGQQAFVFPLVSTPIACAIPTVSTDGARRSRSRRSHTRKGPRKNRTLRRMGEGRQIAGRQTDS